MCAWAALLPHRARCTMSSSTRISVRRLTGQIDARAWLKVAAGMLLALCRGGQDAILRRPRPGGGTGRHSRLKICRPHGHASSILALGTTDGCRPSWAIDEMNFCSHCGSRVTFRVPPGDHLPRYICDSCGTIHYQNPRVVVGVVPEYEGPHPDLQARHRAAQGLLDRARPASWRTASRSSRARPAEAHEEADGGGGDRFAAVRGEHPRRASGARLLPRPAAPCRSSARGRKASR